MPIGIERLLHSRKFVGSNLCPHTEYNVDGIPQSLQTNGELITARLSFHIFLIFREHVFLTGLLTTIIKQDSKIDSIMFHTESRKAFFVVH
jgi:hypothetical protein